MERRHFILAGLAALSGACRGATPEVGEIAIEPLPPPTEVEHLSDLVAAAGLSWVGFVRPREIASVSWLIPPINRIVPEENLDRFSRSSGFDLRQVPEAIVSSYLGRDGGEDTLLYVVRHNVVPENVQRLFQARLTRDVQRSVDAHDVIRISGKAGTRDLAMLRVGRDVAAFQVGGNATRGPMRVAALFAQGLLKQSRTVLAAEHLASLKARFGGAPAIFLARGPFRGELGNAVRGLLSAATAVGFAARPSARDGLAIALAVAGDFSQTGPEASAELEAAWHDLAESTFGRLLGLHEPVSTPLPTHAPDAVALALELDPNTLAEGLRNATSAEIIEIMK